MVSSGVSMLHMASRFISDLSRRLAALIFPFPKGYDTVSQSVKECMGV